MTQTELVKLLATNNDVSNKVAKNLLENLAQTAVKEVKKNGVFALPGWES